MSNYTTEMESKSSTDRVTIFTDFIERVNTRLDEQSKLIQNIQSKAHLMADRQVPEKSSQDEKPIYGNDFSGRLSGVLSTIEGNNFLLEKIYKHLSELI